jgi:hypothetical protein
MARTTLMSRNLALRWEISCHLDRASRALLKAFDVPAIMSTSTELAGTS